MFGYDAGRSLRDFAYIPRYACTDLSNYKYLGITGRRTVSVFVSLPFCRWWTTVRILSVCSKSFRSSGPLNVPTRISISNSSSEYFQHGPASHVYSVAQRNIHQLQLPTPRTRILSTDTEEIFRGSKSGDSCLLFTPMCRWSSLSGSCSKSRESLEISIPTTVLV